VLSGKPFMTMHTKNPQQEGARRMAARPHRPGRLYCHVARGFDFRSVASGHRHYDSRNHTSATSSTREIR